MTDAAYQHPLMAAYWKQLDTRFPQVEEVFEDCMAEALTVLTREGVDAYLEAGRVVGKLGRGAEPMLAFMEEWPSTAKAVGESALPAVMALIQRMQKSPNGRAIAPFLQTLAPVAKRLQSQELLQAYLDLTLDFMLRTTGSIHGHHTTFPSPGLPEFLAQAPHLLNQLSLAGLKNWVEYGVRNYRSHPERQKDYFGLHSADSRAVLQRERHGTLLADVERKLDLYLRGMWHDHDHLVPYSTAFDQIRKPVPYYDKLGIRVPDVYDDLVLPSPGATHHPLPLAGEGQVVVSGLDRYRAVLAHIVGHRRWSEAQIADNWSPFQRMAVEFFEDCRIETLLVREYPGLRGLFLALHPKPADEACDPETTSCLRHRLAMLSRALLDPQHGYLDADLNDFVARFNAVMERGESNTREIAGLALSYVAKTRRASDQFARIHFEDTVVDYRDDNRQMWKFIEEGDEEEAFDAKRKIEPGEELHGLPPRHYPEWDYNSQTYRPDWASVYEALHPSGQAADIDRLLAKHSALARQLKKMLDLLKPQDKVRIRYQEEGSELDLDVALRSLIDFKGGATPDPRINMSHRTSGRDIAVMLLLDLSESLNEKAAGSDQTVLELSQEAVSLLAWAIEKLGDSFAIAGFHSNTRHEVRYLHIKGYGEHWNDDVKARLAAMEAGWSTRMGAAIRHAAHYLDKRAADKKLMLILTDGRPSDVDTADERLLIEDARQAVKELDRQGIFPYCISLDPKADEYVADIFGRQYTVIDRVERLPERLPQLFMALTK
ncbi:MAG: VWA domain-containing protein [Thiobacillus sp.]|uniref:nitric oxide reductase activation protein NorD n=1 Tax=Thiobacillus sp. TaxID=924 RepID=UPI002895BFA2|nr:VWA domain-containing protein [Thiobacillus sp.]MDT3705936.1 VWA domain-containing protein [Thiobacillus sp.]